MTNLHIEDEITDAIRQGSQGSPDWVGFCLRYAQAVNDCLTYLAVHRDDLVLHVYRGQIRIGYKDESHEVADERVGTLDLLPNEDDWRSATWLAAAIPERRGI